MKSFWANLFWIVAAFLTTGGAILVLLPAPGPDKSTTKRPAATRLALRQQGFKTDLSDFNFSTSPEARAREAILKTTVRDTHVNPQASPFVDHPDLMETEGNNTAIVVWQQSSLKRKNDTWQRPSDELPWDEFRDDLNQNRLAVDAAINAILSGPIQFNLNAAGGNSILLPHLAMMRHLILMLNDRMVLALHDGDEDAAWTNLLAATRLVTAWNPEPAEISHLVRFANTKLVFDATWQAFQTNAWTDAQLARLQQEWEAADFFSDLPEIEAFKRASDAQQGEREGNEAGTPQPRPSWEEFFHQATHEPLEAWSELQYHWQQNNYSRYGRVEDEQALLLFWRDREVEIRNAIQAPTWSAMRQLPGVTDAISFHASGRSRFAAILNQRALTRNFQLNGSSFLGRAAEAETRRRITVTAIALERYRAKYDAYPQTLAALAPEFLKTVPVDFMDGEPLRYQLAQQDHFLLYSVGQDCVDNGGKTPPSREDTNPWLGRQARRADSDLVWPLPMGSTEARRKKMCRATDAKGVKVIEENGVWKISEF